MAISETVGVRLSLRGQAQVKEGFNTTRKGLADLKREAGAADRAFNAFDGAARGLTRTLGGVAKNAILGASLAGGALVGTMVAVGVKTAAANEQAQTAFTNMLGSAGAARSYLEELKAFAASTPFELPDVQMGAQRLMAMGVATKDVLPYLTAIGDAVSGMGGGSEQINQVVTAIGQIAAKGKVQGDEILQLTEAGIPALKILAAQYGVSTAEMSKMMEKGKVASADALPKLIDGIENGTSATKAFGGMMEAQSKTLAGRWSTIKDVTTQGLAGAVEPLLPTLSEAMDWLGRKLPDGMKSLERASDNVAGTLNVLRPVFSLLWDDVKLVTDAFTQGFRDSGYSLDDVREGADNMTTAFDPNGPLVQGTVSLAENLGRVAGFMSTMAAKAEALNPLIDRLNGMAKGEAAYDPTNLGVKQLTGGKVDLAKSGWIKNTPKPDPNAPFYFGGFFNNTAKGGNRQGGGNVTAGKAYRVGERGPEWMIPQQSGRVTPRPDVRGMLSEGYINITVPVTVNDEEIARATVRGVKRQAARRR